MGRLKKIIYICLAMVLCLTATVPSVHAAENIDIDRDCTLTVQYANSGRACEGMEVKIYRVASVDVSGKYMLCEAFSSYDVTVNDVTSQGAWQETACTLAAYAAADQIRADRSDKTNSSGIAIFSDLTPGMYLTVTDSVMLGAERITFENFLTAVPHPDGNGAYSYNVTAYPKSEEVVPEKGEVEYKVVKHWKDSANKDKRPDSIRVEIIRNGDHESYQTLSPDNNWTYSWKAADDSSEWQVVERDKPAGYKVKIEKAGRTVIITNTLTEKTPPAEEGENKQPQTGDTTSMWPFVGVMCSAGAVMLLLAIWRKREE